MLKNKVFLEDPRVDGSKCSNIEGVLYGKCNNCFNISQLKMALFGPKMHQNFSYFGSETLQKCSFHCILDKYFSHGDQYEETRRFASSM